MITHSQKGFVNLSEEEVEKLSSSSWSKTTTFRCPSHATAFLFPHPPSLLKILYLFDHAADMECLPLNQHWIRAWIRVSAYLDSLESRAWAAPSASFFLISGVCRERCLYDSRLSWRRGDRREPCWTARAAATRMRTEKWGSWIFV